MECGLDTVNGRGKGGVVNLANVQKIGAKMENGIPDMEGRTERRISQV